MAASPAMAQGEVNVYSYREPQLIDPLVKAFTDKTGIKVNIVYAAAGLNERLAAEGANSPADLLFTVDAGRLSEAKDAGLTQPVEADAGAGGDPRAAPRSRQPLVRPDDARPRHLRLQGSREAGRDHLRGAGRPEVEGQDLLALGPARLQHVAARHDHRPQGRGGGRGVGARASRTTWRRSRPAAIASRCATCSRASATSPSATPITWR